MSHSTLSSTDMRWDAIDPAALLELVPFRKMTTEFGYLLRHYWMPDTEIQFCVRAEQWNSNGDSRSSERIVRQTLARCDADRITWRERNIEQQNEENLIQCSPLRCDDTLCFYDRSAQALRCCLPLEFERQPVHDTEAMTQAFLQQPILTPLMPIPVGFTWNIGHDDGYLDFTLESVTRQGEMTVLFIRRTGKFLLHEYFLGGTRYEQDYLVEREGITAYALERSMILEDRTQDIFQSSATVLNGVTTRTVRTLIRSEWKMESRCSAPMIMPLSPVNDKSYTYDCGTGRILRMDEPTQRILGDFRVLTDEEIRLKHQELGSEKVEASLALIHKAAKDGFFAEHPPMELIKVETTEYDGTEHDLGEFWKNTGMLLVLGITEKCNLCCSYCCFSGKFAGHRTHSTKTMSWDVAKRAISYFLEHDLVGADYYPITFYGGEPLVELELLKRCVEFAKSKAKELGKVVRFAVTTNGTLLNDDVLDYLVEHEFMIMVSIDGAEVAHDRYRVFPNGAGSFERVYRNVKRFVERYPDYPHRALNMTLAPPLDLDAAAALVDELVPHYPLTRVALVNPGTECRFRDGQTEGTTRYGCFDQCKQKQSSPVSLESFRDFAGDDFRKISERWTNCKAALIEHGVEKTREMMPFNMFLFEQQIYVYHRRKVTNNAWGWFFYVPCVPGFTRRFCDAEGNYRVCERVDDSQTYLMGNVWDGPDTKRLLRTMEMRRHFGDCANCSAIKTCDLCYARIPDTDAIGEGFDPLFDMMCQRTRKGTAKMIGEYNEIMERNPAALPKKQPKDGTRKKNLKYSAPNQGYDQATLSRMQLEIL